MKVLILIVIYIFTSIFCVSSKELEIDYIEAIVNDQIILNSDVNKILLFFNKDGKNFLTPLKTDFFKEKVIEKLIIDALILQEANKKHIMVTDKQIDTMVKNIALQKNMNVNQLKNYIISHDINDNFSYKNYLKNIKNLLTIKMMEDYELKKRVKISEQSVNITLKKLIHNNKKFKKVNLSYILLPILRHSSRDMINCKKQIAKHIVNKLKRGYDFEKIYAECQKNTNFFVLKKMFWTRAIDIQNDFPDLVRLCKKGQVLGPFFSNKGIYILKVNDIHNNKENIINELHIQHCFIKSSNIKNEKELKNNIFNIYNNLKKGTYSFDYAVKNLSEDVNASSNNGDVGWISEKYLHDHFNTLLSYLKKDDISQPIKSDFGWHIFKVLDKRQIDEFYNLSKQEAYNTLLHKKIQLEKRHWIKDLKKNSYIKIIRQ